MPHSRSAIACHGIVGITSQSVCPNLADWVSKTSAMAMARLREWFQGVGAIGPGGGLECIASLICCFSNASCGFCSRTSERIKPDMAIDAPMPAPRLSMF